MAGAVVAEGAGHPEGGVDRPGVDGREPGFGAGEAGDDVVVKAGGGASADVEGERLVAVKNPSAAGAGEGGVGERTAEGEFDGRAIEERDVAAGGQRPDRGAGATLQDRAAADTDTANRPMPPSALPVPLTVAALPAMLPFTKSSPPLTVVAPV